MIDGIAADLFFWFSGRVVGSQDADDAAAAIKPELPPYYLSPIKHLTVSDKNKTFLIESSSAIALITEGLLLDAEHVRQNQDEAIKAGIQQDAAESFLQIALFEPGRQILMEDSAAMAALHILADGQALTEEARQYAYGAVIAIEGVNREPEPAREEGGDEVGSHIMASYQ